MRAAALWRAPAREAPIARGTEKAARLMVALAESKQAEDVVVLDMRRAGLLTDYFLICTGSSTRQAKAIADAIWEGLEEEGVPVRHIEGYHEAQWILVDCGDAVAHIFHTPLRGFYDLEHLWGDMPRLALS